ncbi:fungal-specific transcription factor domain-containing protein [Aspergillus karnatakaensis]|uniref:Zn(II)2Cys6 transcription factor n=1 Tax=Aspergillus karnatakaensis TaxID=1810916 RepID=UPI003CCD3CB5
MPRPRRPGAPEPKRRSRKGCWPCKARKVKCGEEKPACLNCQRQNEPCDYSIRLNWGGRTRRTSSVDSPDSLSSSFSVHSSSFPISPPSISPLPASPNQPFEARALEENTVQDSRQEPRATGGEILGRTYPSRLPEIQNSPTVLDQSLSTPMHTMDRAPVDMGPPRERKQDIWPGESLLGEQLPSTLSVSISQNDPQYPPLPDLNTIIHEFPDFNFPSGPISQPLSFVRPAVDGPVCSQGLPLNQEDCAYRQDYPRSPPVAARSADASDCHSRSPSHSHETLSPQSLDTSLFIAETPHDFNDTTDSFLAGILDGSPGCDGDKIEHGRTKPVYQPTYEGQACFGQPRRRLSQSEKKWQTYLTSVTDHYGMDCGRPDADLGNNDDHSAIDISDALEMIQSRSHVSSPGNIVTENAIGAMVNSNYEYYALPVPINIPRYLSPLPPSLVEVPINLMYFHHFLNHTARVLVPHDCGSNPFSSVLPSMAMSDSNLLNLMLAYSASHRARFLGHSEPTTRIAHWVSNVFPSLRIALEDAQQNITDSHLATAIMLLSLKIVSPSTFEVPVPWQSHLKLARDLFLARQSQMTYPDNRVGAFLTRWLGYLDILGSLSCRHHMPPLLEYYTVLSTCSAAEDWDEYAVDCFTGFTPRTGLFLMKLGGLLHQCDNQRFDDAGNFLNEWEPSSAIILEAQALVMEWEALDERAHAHDRHYLDAESSDMISVDHAFRYAGLIQLHRRVLGNGSTSDVVSSAVEGLMQALRTIQSGSAVEAGVLFPIFTAGCESQDLEQRIDIKERLDVLERTGMKQFRSARGLMQRCWDTNLPWIVFAQGEFIG